MSDVKDAVGRILVPINKEGYFIILVSFVISMMLLSLSTFIGMLALILTFLILYFFRDPERVVPDDKNVVVASADGVVDKIEEISAPKELGLDSNLTFQRVSIFLNVFNVHVQRIPISGKITKLEYVQGKFLNITNDKFSLSSQNWNSSNQTGLNFDLAAGRLTAYNNFIESYNLKIKNLEDRIKALEL